jgi:hypothetical protein
MTTKTTLTRDERRKRGIRNMIAATVITTVLFLGMVFASGETFGQRCDRAYPGDRRATTACVERLASGGVQ